MALDLFTCSYPEMRSEMGVPVRFTVGNPRYKLRYPLVHQFPLGTPTRAMLKMPKAQYRGVYFDLLNERGVGPISDQLLAIAQEAGDQRLVLLCFENLGKPGLWCHRTMFAEWWKDTIGDDVRELGARPDSGPAPAPEPDPQTALFP